MAEAETESAEQAHPPIRVIDTRPGYLDAVRALAGGTGPIAVDAERASGFRYSQRAYLVQMFRRGAGVFLFDPPAIGDFTELAELIADEEWVLHAASQDLACLREIGLDPRRIFDTELAARLLGLARVGLGPVVEELLGVHLAKEHSAADWSTRPLPESWLVYAALDVELLVDVRDRIEQLLADAGKTGIAEQEFRATLAKETPTRTEPWRRLSGLHTVRTQRGLAIARALWHARDEYAREVDTAPGRLVPDPSLVAVARTPPASKRELAAMKEFTGRASRSQLERWWAALQAGIETEDLPPMRVPGDGGPPPPRAWADRNPEADTRLRFARAALIARAEQLNLPVENLLTPDWLRRVAWDPPQELSAEAVAERLAQLGARPWQTEATAQLIVNAFVDSVQVGDEASAPVSSAAANDSED